jgi:hypothetical protein
MKSTKVKRKKQNKSRLSTQKGSAKAQQQSLGPQIGAPSSISQQTKKVQPKVTMPRFGCIRIRNRELIQNVSVPNNLFNILGRFRVNPGSKKTFPWLSGQALSYESFKFHKLKFEFITRCPSNTSGSMYLSPDYDSADALPVGETEVAANVDTVENVAWESIHCQLKTEKMNRAYKAHYNMTDTRFDATKQDQKTIDPAFVVLAGQVDGFTMVGKFWVEYDCELFEPQRTTDVDNQGGLGSNKVSGLAPNVVDVFTTGTVATLNQEVVPILKVLNGTAFPGPNLFEFTRDWQGFLTKNITGTGITNIGGILKNGAPIPTAVATVINGAQTNATYQAFDSFKAGDVLGSAPVNSATLTSIIHNLGGSGVI